MRRLNFLSVRRAGICLHLSSLCFNIVMLVYHPFIKSFSQYLIQAKEQSLIKICLHPALRRHHVHNKPKNVQRFLIVLAVNTVYTTRAPIKIKETIVPYIQSLLSECSSGDGRSRLRRDYFLGQCQKVN
jgi:hypothetical protein